MGGGGLTMFVVCLFVFWNSEWVTGRRWLNRYHSGLPQDPPGDVDVRTCTNYFIGTENCYSHRRQLFLIPTIQHNLIDRMWIGMSAFLFQLPFGQIESISSLSSVLDVTMIRSTADLGVMPMNRFYLPNGFSSFSLVIIFSTMCCTLCLALFSPPWYLFFQNKGCECP